jgi:hypothetical protein
MKQSGTLFTELGSSPTISDLQKGPPGTTSANGNNTQKGLIIYQQKSKELIIIRYIFKKHSSRKHIITSILSTQFPQQNNYYAQGESIFCTEHRVHKKTTPPHND